jgi:hypothetical protein
MRAEGTDVKPHMMYRFIAERRKKQVGSTSTNYKLVEKEEKLKDDE